MICDQIAGILKGPAPRVVGFHLEVLPPDWGTTSDAESKVRIGVLCILKSLYRVRRTTSDILLYFLPYNPPLA